MDARCTSEVARRREDGVCCRIMVVADEDGGCRGFWCVAGEVRRCGEDGGAGFLLFPASFSGGRRGWRRRLPWRMEGEEKIRVRVLGDEDDDVAESDWLIW